MKATKEGAGEVLEKQLGSLRDYIGKLYALGGVPLVLIGVGAANLFLPYGDTSEAIKLTVTILLFVLAVGTWAASTYVALQRWKTELQIVAKQDELVLSAICRIAVDQTSDVTKEKAKALREALYEAGARLPRAREEPEKRTAANEPSRTE